jgi:hypothetical protein
MKLAVTLGTGTLMSEMKSLFQAQWLLLNLG